MKKLFLLLLALTPVLVHAGYTGYTPTPPPKPKATITTVSLTFTANQPAYSSTYPSYRLATFNGKTTTYTNYYSTVTSATCLPLTPAVAVEKSGSNGAFTITPVGVGTTVMTILYTQPEAWNGSVAYVNNTYIYNITVNPVTTQSSVTIPVDKWTSIPTPTAMKSYTVTNDGIIDAAWSVTAQPSLGGIAVTTHNLGTDVVHVFDGAGNEYDYNVTATLWTPASGQVVLANVSTSQPEYQTLIANRPAAVNYAENTIGMWPYAVRRRWPNGMFAAGTYLTTVGTFNYNTLDNVTVLEATYCNYIEFYNPVSADSETPSSSGSTGVAYDPDHGTIYGDPSGNSAVLPYSASMAITGTGASLEIANIGSGYLGFNRLTNTNLTVIGVTSTDDAGFGTSWDGYEISYLETGSLPSEQPPVGAITVSKPQVLTKGTVTISYTLN